MAREILVSHIKEEGSRRSLLLSLLGHGLLLAVFVFGVRLFEPPVLILGGGGGGEGGDNIVTGELIAPSAFSGGDRQMYKPSIKATPETLPVEEKPKKEETPLRPEEKVFEEAKPDKVPPKPEEKRAEPLPVTPPPRRDVPEPSKGAIPQKADPGTGGAPSQGLRGTGGTGPGGGSGTGGVSLGSGAGDGIDSWYIRQMERRIAQNWLNTALGRLESRVKTRMAFEISRNGRIESVEILESSGVRSIDLAAERAIRASDPLPPVPSELGHRRLRVIANFEYPPP